MSIRIRNHSVLIAVTISMFTFIMCIPVYAQMPTEAQITVKKSEFIPGQLIIQLKEGRNLAEITDLNTKYGVSTSRKVFQDISEPQEVLKQLNTKLAKLSLEHRDWYWYLDKNSPEYKTYQEKLDKEKDQLKNQIKAQEEFVASMEDRQKRAPEGASVPDLSSIYLLQANENVDMQAIQLDYAAHPAIANVSPNYMVSGIGFPAGLPNDTYAAPNGEWVKTRNPAMPDLANLLYIKADKAWSQFLSKGLECLGEGVVVAVVDSGVDYNHVDIRNNIWRNTREIPGNGIDDDGNGYKDDVLGMDFIDKDWCAPKQDTDPMDGFGHGTAVAGIIAAEGNNGIGIIGIAPKAKIMAVRVLSDQDRGGWDVIAKGIKYAADNGADIINLSLGGMEDEFVMREVIEYAVNKRGVVVVAGAGNSNGDVKYFYPAAYPEVITVAAYDLRSRGYDSEPVFADKASFSNWGLKIDVIAPGTNLLTLRAANTDMNFIKYPAESEKDVTQSSSVVNQDYYIFAGTSGAAPHVSGEAALIIGCYKKGALGFSSLNVSQIKNIICHATSTDGKTWGQYFGYGHIDIQKSLAFPDPSPLEEVKLYSQGSGMFSVLYSSVLPVPGSASLLEGFQQYKVEYQFERDPEQLWRSDGVVLSNGGKNPVKDGVLAVITVPKIELASPSARENIRVRLTVEGASKTTTYSRFYVVDYRIIPGWPKKVTQTGISAAHILKYSPESKNILVVGDAAYMLGKDGSQVGHKYVSQNPENEDNLYINDAAFGLFNTISTSNSTVVTQEYTNDLKQGALNIYYSGSSVPVQVKTPDSTLGKVVLADVNKDGVLEIINVPKKYVKCKTSKDELAIKIFDQRGKLLKSLPKLDWTYDFDSAVAADIDNDGTVEIVATCSQTVTSLGQPLLPAYLIVYDYSTGQEKARLETPRLLFPLRLADLNNDGALEIAGAYKEFVSGQSLVKAHLMLYSFKNKVLTEELDINTGDSYAYMKASLLIADIDKDGQPELISCNGIWKHRGSGTWPKDYELWKPLDNYIQPVLAADISGDGYLDIIGLRAGWQLCIIDSQTNSEINTGIDSSDYNVLGGACPVVYDFNNDGKNEILCEKFNENDFSDVILYQYATPGIANVAGGWPQENYDSFNSGIYGGNVAKPMVRILPKFLPAPTPAPTPILGSDPARNANIPAVKPVLAPTPIIGSDPARNSNSTLPVKPAVVVSAKPESNARQGKKK